MKHTVWLSIVGAAGIAVSASLSAMGAEETAAERDARMAWWREAKFGLFIHWGVYAVPAGNYQGREIPGIGEWIMLRAQIPTAEYKAYAQHFNPVDYDPEAWVRLARDAGMKYIVITSKHHDGFALYDSAVTDWDVVDATPYGRDLLRPLAEAAHRAGLRFGVYYSQAQDWNHPGGAKAGFQEGDGWDDAHKGDFDEYLERIAIPQTRELLSGYDLDIFWWDTPTWMTPERAGRLAPLLELRPDIITNNRLGGGYAGDTETPEQHIPSQGYRNRDWETCMTMNDTWGFKAQDHNWKDSRTLVHNLVDIVSKGGNYLLNVGPTARGTIPEPSQELLREVGEWMNANGQSIYGAQAGPFPPQAWGRCTLGSRDGRPLYYLHIFDWKDGDSITIPLANRPVRASLLNDSERTLTCTGGDDNGIQIQLSGPAPDPLCSVIALEIEGDPTFIRPRVSQNSDGELILSATTAELVGNAIQVETRYGDPNIGFWTRAEDSVNWPIRLSSPGRFQVTLHAACPNDTAGSQLQLQIGAASVQGTVPGTGGYDRFQPCPIGEITLPAGDYEASLSVTHMPGGAVMNLQHIALTPIRD